MGYRSRIYYTEEQKSLMWDRWQAGDSLREIAQLFDRHHSSVRASSSDSIVPADPPPTIRIGTSLVVINLLLLLVTTGRSDHH